MREFFATLNSPELALVFALMGMAAAFFAVRSFRGWKEVKDTRLLIIAISLAGTGIICLVILIDLLSLDGG